ncbi:hypothetical protein V3C99_014817 [Haemonchus contortus]
MSERERQQSDLVFALRTLRGELIVSPSRNCLHTHSTCALARAPTMGSADSCAFLSDNSGSVKVHRGSCDGQHVLSSRNDVSPLMLLSSICSMIFVNDSSSSGNL